MIVLGPDQILLHHTNQLISQSSLSQSNFVHELLLPALTKAGLEKQDDHRTADEYSAWHSAKVRQVNSILNGNTNIPLRWLWCWLEVLPEPYGSAARKELLAQGGVLDVSVEDVSGQLVIDMDQVTNKADIPTFMREAADVMTAAASVAADGVYDSNDDPEQLKALADELSDVVTNAMTQLASIGQVVDLSGGRANAIVQMLKTTKEQINQ